MAIGMVPNNAAMVVIMIGRKRNRHASRMASAGVGPRARASMAKSTIMMAFFLTMPTSRIMPITAMMVSSMSNSQRIISAPRLADGSPDRMVIGWMKLSYRMPSTM